MNFEQELEKYQREQQELLQRMYMYEGAIQVLRKLIEEEKKERTDNA